MPDVVLLRDAVAYWLAKRGCAMTKHEIARETGLSSQQVHVCFSNLIKYGPNPFGITFWKSVSHEVFGTYAATVTGEEIERCIDTPRDLLHARIEEYRQRNEIKAAEIPSVSFNPKIKNATWHCYWVFAEGLNRVKIGRASNVKTRFADLQHASPVRLTLLYSEPYRPFHVDGEYFNLEGQLHTRFSLYRLHGEWFTFAQPLQEYLQEKGAMSAKAQAS